MISRPCLFCYSAKETVIHRIPAGIKLCFLWIGSLIPAKGVSMCYCVYAVVLLCGCLLAHLTIETVKKNFRFLLVYGVFFFLLKMVGLPIALPVFISQLCETVVFMQRFTLILFTASLFYETTSKLELLVFFESVEDFFLPHTVPRVFSLVFTLTLMSIPRIFSTWAALNYAYDARNQRVNMQNIQPIYSKQRHIYAGMKDAVDRAFFLLPPLVELLLQFVFNAEKAVRNRTVRW